MEKQIVLTNKIDELPVLATKIEELAEAWDLPMPLSMNLNLVMEEAITNIIFYAFPEGGIHQIIINLSLSGNELTIEIIDEGIPFDPTSKEQPDTNLPAEERPIGGLGIFLIRKMMDNVSYKRDKNKNILTLKKKF